MKSLKYSTIPQGGNFVLQIPDKLWPILMQNKTFEGIKPSPNPKPNPDGSRTVKLTPAQWQIFQDNQKKPPIPVPAEPKPGKEPTDKPSDKPDKPSEKPSNEPSDEITVTKDPSMLKNVAFFAST